MARPLAAARRRRQPRAAIGGDGGEGASGIGGGIFNATSGTLTIKPRLGAKQGVQAGPRHRRHHGQSGSGRIRRAGRRRRRRHGRWRKFALRQRSGHTGQPGAIDLFSVGIGGGIANFGTANIDNTTITGNHASTNDNDVDGTITP